MNLIQEQFNRRLSELGLTRQEFIRNYPYPNKSKADRNLERFLLGDSKNKNLLITELAKFLQLNSSTIHQWSKDFAQQKSDLQKAHVLKNFRPHGIFTTVTDRPRSIWASSVTGAANRRTVKLEHSEPEAYVGIMLDILTTEREKIRLIEGVWSDITGFAINHSPNLCFYYNRQGHRIKESPKAYRIGSPSVTID